jgi:hypothetical protein
VGILQFGRGLIDCIYIPRLSYTIPKELTHFLTFLEQLNAPIKTVRAASATFNH